jgi:hypothetical protein
MESPSPIAPKHADKPPKAYIYGLLASGGWVVGWPVLYANFNPALKNAAWLTHAAATLWFFSLIALFVFLALLTEYWPALSYVWDVLGFLVEFLSLFVG